MSRPLLLVAMSLLLLLGVASVVAGSSSASVGESPGTEAPEGGAAGPTAHPAPPETGPRAGKTRTRQEVIDLIQTVGSTLPDWFDSVPLEYPDTLNLRWEQVVKGSWAPDHNLGAYMLTRIVERPGKWRHGIKLLHHCLEVNRNNPSGLQTTRENLATRYLYLFQDYARAAYWNGQARNSDPVLLAECCWKLGSKELAVEVLSAVGPDRRFDARALKLWGEMGEHQNVLALADRVAGAGQLDLAYLLAGDAARVSGRYQEALGYYQQGAALQQSGRRNPANRQRARASAQAVAAFAGQDLSAVPDGTHTGKSEGFKGPLEVEVTVKDGRIESVVVPRHRENWYGASIEYVPARIVEEQGVEGVDAVTHATTTSRAIINATMNALAGPPGGQ